MYVKENHLFKYSTVKEMGLTTLNASIRKLDPCFTAFPGWWPPSC